MDVKQIITIYFVVVLLLIIIAAGGDKNLNVLLNTGSKLGLIFILLALIVGVYFYLRFVKITIPCRTCEMPGWYYKCSEGTGMGSEICKKKVEKLEAADEAWNHVASEVADIKHQIDNAATHIKENMLVLKEKGVEYLNSQMSQIQASIQKVVEMYNENIKPTIDSAKSFVYERFMKLYNELIDIYNLVKGKYLTSKEFITNKLQEFWNMAQGNVQKIKSGFVGFIKDFYAGIQLRINTIVEEMSSLYVSLQQVVISPIVDKLRILSEVIQSIGDGLAQVFSTLDVALVQVLGFFDKLVSEIIGKIQIAINDFMDKVKFLLSYIGASEVVDQVKSFFATVNTILATPARAVITAIGIASAKIREVIETISGKIKDLVTTILSPLNFENLYNNLTSLAVFVVDNLQYYFKGLIDGYQGAESSEVSLTYKMGYSVGSTLPFVFNYISNQFTTFAVFVIENVINPMLGAIYMIISDFVQFTLQVKDIIVNLFKIIAGSVVIMAKEVMNYVQPVNILINNIVSQIGLMNNEVIILKDKLMTKVHLLQEKLKQANLSQQYNEIVSIVKTEAVGMIPRSVIMYVIIVVCILVLAFVAIPTLTLNVASR